MRLFLLGIGLCVMAVGLDYFDGIENSYDTVVEHTPLARGDARHIFRAVEEFVEMVGTTFILVAFLQHWQRGQLSSPLRSPYVGQSADYSYISVSHVRARTVTSR